MEYKYNRQGERVYVKDQNGTVHEYEFDLLGRLTQDRVTATGTNIEDRVLRVAHGYEVRGMLQTVTNYDNATVGSGAVLNEVKFVYNDFGQLTTEYQDHDAVINEQTTPKVGYSYANGADNHVRPTKVTYPDGRELNFNYGTTGSVSDYLSRVAALVDDDGSTHLADYSYLGVGGISKVDLTQPDLRFDLDHGTPQAYAALDTHGRVVDHRWYDYGSSSDAVRIKHGYDRASNRLYRENDVANTISVDADELYTYDDAYRITRFQRGDVSTDETPSISLINFQTQWVLDSTGNCSTFTENTDGQGGQEIVQSREHNKANEITRLDDAYPSSNGNWDDPAHDRAGNMIEMPQPAAPTDHYHMDYDAWNRLVEVRAADNETLVAGYEYDGLNRRTVKEVYDSGSLDEVRHFYYSAQWQVLEERAEVITGSSGGGVPEDADTQYVWGLRYVDDLILRDRDTTGDGTFDERLYALQDANWNVVALAEPNGTIAQRFIYDAYGKATELNEDFTDYTDSDYSWPYLFTGRRLDEETGLMQYRNRYYHIQLGRFVTRDPIEYEARSMSLYGYVENSPLMRTDPHGLVMCDCGYGNDISGGLAVFANFILECSNACDGIGGYWNGMVYGPDGGPPIIGNTVCSLALYDDQPGGGMAGAAGPDNFRCAAINLKQHIGLSGAKPMKGNWSQGLVDFSVANGCCIMSLSVMDHGEQFGAALPTPQEITKVCGKLCEGAEVHHYGCASGTKVNQWVELFKKCKKVRTFSGCRSNGMMPCYDHKTQKCSSSEPHCDDAGRQYFWGA